MSTRKSVMSAWGDCLFPGPYGPSSATDYFGSRFDMVELLVHVEGAGPDDPVEFFIMDNDRRITNKQFLDAASAQDKEVLVCIDWHYGCGRRETSSAVQGGKYHRGIHEGGYREALVKFLSWARHYDCIWGIKLGNEQRVPDEWYYDNVEYTLDKVPSHWEMVVGGEESNMAAGLRAGATLIDIHLLRSDWKDRLTRARSICDGNVMAGIVVTEMCPPLDLPDQIDRSKEWVKMLVELENDSRVEAVSMFAGGDHFKNRDRVYWNFKWLRQFLSWTIDGKTWLAESFDRHFELDGGAVEPPEPPTDECASVRGRCGLIADRLMEAQGEADALIDDGKVVRAWKRLDRQIDREVERLEEIENG